MVRINGKDIAAAGQNPQCLYHWEEGATDDSRVKLSIDTKDGEKAYIYDETNPVERPAVLKNRGLFIETTGASVGEIMYYSGDTELGSTPTDKGHYTLTEYAYHKMALCARIEMSECRLCEENGRHHFMTRRFDRKKETSEKLHMQTLGALAHFDYGTPGIYSYEQTEKIMRERKLGQKDVEQLYRRMVFNIFARNQDDHVKNISFLMDKNGEWRLSPAYDVTYAYNPWGKWTGNHQMTMNGKREGFEKDDFFACASSMSIKKEKARSIIEEVQEAIGKWRDFAEESGLTEEEYMRIGKTFETLEK